MKNLFRLLLLVGMLSVAPQVWGGAVAPDPDPEWTPQVTLNHFAPDNVWAGTDSFSLVLERTNGNDTYYMVLDMWVDASGIVQVSKYCSGNEKLCLAIGSGKNCDRDGYSPWCYMPPHLFK